MNNLFSIFDPKLSILMLNWMSLTMVLILPSKFWLTMSQALFVFKGGLLSFAKEFKHIMKPAFPSSFLLFLTAICLFILSINVSSLIPYTFSSTSHLSIALTLAFPFWAGAILWNLKTNLSSFMAHLLPLGTPIFLACFMVVIELVSNIIRPMTLSIRLVANVVPGHLLLALIGGYVEVLPGASMIFLYMGGMLLVVLESGVALIQAYVFSVLSTLYFMEVNNPNN